MVKKGDIKTDILLEIRNLLLFKFQIICAIFRQIIFPFFYKQIYIDLKKTYK